MLELLPAIERAKKVYSLNGLDPPLIHIKVKSCGWVK